jgi:hypothetical protein
MAMFSAASPTGVSINKQEVNRALHVIIANKEALMVRSRAVILSDVKDFSQIF